MMRSLQKPSSSWGQAIVEFALVLPLLMFVLLGFAEVAFLVANRYGYQNSVDVLADWVAEEMASHPGESWQAGWNAVVNDEIARTGCNDNRTDVSFPDGTHLPGDRVVVEWRCVYQPQLTATWVNLPVRVQSASVVPGVLPPPTPNPSSSPTPSPMP